eukprot:TRINITY_DN8424_c2_g1_i2.p1 TRINITY_DN8424_c2_g1~~TRINITY_DN8424_c2_g1_i2.p1  ORF type:complete len:736 (+),score=139.58 TRINITY_DN8424_c2_g1_i2:35-2242(+)
MGAGCVKDQPTEAPDALHIPAAQQERRQRRRKLADYRNCVYAVSAFERHQSGVWSDAGVQAMIRFAQELPIPTIMFTEDGSIGFANEQTIELSGVSDLQCGNHINKIIDYGGDLEDLCYKEVTAVSLIHPNDTTTPINMYTIAFYVDTRQRSTNDLNSSQSSSTGLRQITEKVLTDVPVVFISFFDTSEEIQVTRQVPQVFKDVGKRVVTLGGSAALQADIIVNGTPTSDKEDSSDSSDAESESNSSRSGILRKLDLRGTSPRSSAAASPASSDSRRRHRWSSQNTSQPSSEVSFGRVSSGRVVSPRQPVSSKFDALSVAMGIGDVLIIIDPVHQIITSASPAALNFLGYSSVADIVGKPTSIILHPSEHETDEDPLDSLSRLADLSGSSLAGEHRVTFITSPETKDALTANVVSVSSLTPTSVIFRIGAVAAPSGKRAGVRFQYKGFPDELAIMVNSFADATLVTSLTGQVLHFNGTFSNMFGYDVDDVYEKDVTVFIPESFAKSHMEHVKRLSANHNKTSRKMLKRHRSVIGVMKGGEAIPLDISISEINPSVETTFYVVTVRRVLTTEIVQRYQTAAASLMVQAGYQPSAEFERSRNNLLAGGVVMRRGSYPSSVGSLTPRSIASNTPRSVASSIARSTSPIPVPASSPICTPDDDTLKPPAEQEDLSASSPHSTIPLGALSPAPSNSPFIRIDYKHIVAKQLAASAAAKAAQEVCGFLSLNNRCVLWFGSC